MAKVIQRARGKVVQTQAFLLMLHGGCWHHANRMRAVWRPRKGPRQRVGAGVLHAPLVPRSGSFRFLGSAECQPFWNV